MWIPTARRQHSRCGLRYETDLTDAEWALIEPALPPPCDRGRPREWSLRDGLDAIFTCCAAGSPGAFCPTTWRDNGLFDTGLR
jgi:transposase